VLVLLTAYFDETGIHKGARLTAMSGFIARAADWAIVEAKWRARLDEDPPEFRVRIFHAVDCENGRGGYSDLTYWNRARRDLLKGELAGILASSPISAISSGLLQADWDDVIAKVAGDDFKIRFPAAYHLCFEHCLQQAFVWSEKFASNAPVALIFAEHQEHRDWSEKILQAYQASPRHGHKIASISFRRQPNWFHCKRPIFSCMSSLSP
jgi:hypothetical protein